MMNETTVGQKIATIRKQLGLNYVQFAERVGTNTSVIWNLENGKRKPSFDMLGKVADALGVTSDYLVGTDRPANRSLKEQILADPIASILFHGTMELPERDKAVFVEFCEMVIALNRKSGKSAQIEK